MKFSFFLCPALVLAALSARAVSVDIELTPANHADYPYVTVQVTNMYDGERFTVFFKGNETNDTFLHAQLDVSDTDHKISSVPVTKKWTTNGVEYVFTVPKSCVAASKFTVSEPANTGARPMPGFVHHWFYLRSFSPSHAAAVVKWDEQAASFFRDYLARCGMNEIRCLWFLQDNPKVGMLMTINLGTESVFTAREVYSWATQNSETRRLSHSQKMDLEKIIRDLPATDKSIEFNRSVSVSILRAGKVGVFQYNRRHAPPVIQRIYDLGGGYFYDGGD